jgi:glutamate 5-kinase
VHQEWLKTLADDVAKLKASGKDVLIVSSGAIALGRQKLGLHDGSLNLEEAQAAAAAGQIDLVHAYQNTLQPLGFAIAQVLLTLSDTEERRRYLNARDTIETLLKADAIPVINENDTVATSEIRFGDNDRLAARVASMVSADCLVLLSDIDGLYREDPALNPNAEFIEEVPAITEEIEAMAGPPTERTASSIGSGGMATKLIAGKIAIEAGCHMVVTSGKRIHPIKALLDGERATWFVSSDTPKAARKRWISGGLNPEGVLVVDAGAEKALKTGGSLLPAGVKTVRGNFERGSNLDIENEQGQLVARGLSAYSSDDASLIIGRNSSEIEGVLGYRGRSELVHRDDMILK